MQQFGVQVLGDYIDFLVRLFSGWKLLFLSRDHQQEMSSSWWAQSTSPDLLRANLKKFDKWADEYCLSHQNGFKVRYKDMVEINLRLGDMFQFLGEKLDTQKIEQVLDVTHSYGAGFVKTRYAGLVSRANYLFNSGDHKNSIKAFDKTVAYGLEHKLPLNVSCTRRSSYNSYRVISTEDPALAYFPMSKCACSTVKTWLMSIEHTRRSAPGLRQAVEPNVNPHNYWSFEATLNLDKYQQHQKFTVVRDPLERFLSFYTNFCDRISRKQFDGDYSCIAYVKRSTDINNFIDYFCSQPIHNFFILHHTMPQSILLKDSFMSMDEVFTVNQLDTVREFLEATFEMALPVIQKNASNPAHKNKAVGKLSRVSVEKLMRYYAKDYKLLKNYFDPQKTLDRLAP